MDLGLKNKNAIVTGGSRGIGLAIAKGFAQEGANVSICARSEGPLSAATISLKSYGNFVHSMTCDVSDPIALHDYIETAHNVLGGLDILVNNPSGFGRTDDEAGWKMSIDIDLMASVRGCWSAVPLIENSGGGSIIHISSISAENFNKIYQANNQIDIVDVRKDPTQMNELMKVSGQSMTPTLQNDDFVVADFDIEEFEDAMSKNPQEATKL